MTAHPTEATLNADSVMQLAQQHAANPGCTRCAVLRCDGWEAFPGTADERDLRRIGSLRPAGDEEPTLDEHHPQGTHYWSPQAPIALAFHPYNRCELWACVGCGKPFLRYTEYGGYYEEKRIRALRAELLTPAG